MQTALGTPQAEVIRNAAAEPFDSVPIIVGVTGHRDIPAQAEEQLGNRFADILTGLRTDYPDTPVLVMTSLAAGADLIAAEKALRLEIPVVAILPKAPAQFEDDFDAAGRTRFRAALSRCREVIVVESPPGAPHRYVAASAYIAYYAHVVVAFWDGETNGGPGGTADMVRLRLSGISAGFVQAAMPYVPDVGPVYQIVSPRAAQPVPQRSYRLIRRYPQRYRGDRTAARDFQAALRNLNRYNRDLAAIPQPSVRDPLEAIGDRTSEIADRLQSASLRSMSWTYVWALLAGAAQAMEFGFPGVVLKLLILAIAFTIFVRARRADFENRYQDYRALAEALRVQRAWCCAGMRDRPVEASYLRMQHGELQWIRLALRTVFLEFGGRHAIEGAGPSHPHCLEWLRSQRAYYLRASGRELRNKQRLARASTVSSIVALVVVVAAAVPLALQFLQQSDVVHRWLPSIHVALDLHWVTRNQRLVTNLAGVPLALAGLIALLGRFYGEQRGFSENARRYQHMYVVFDYGLRRMHQIQKYGIGADAPALLEQIGREALTEHANWLILHRERPFTFVHT